MAKMKLVADPATGMMMGSVIGNEQLPKSFDVNKFMSTVAQSLLRHAAMGDEEAQEQINKQLEDAIKAAPEVDVPVRGLTRRVAEAAGEMADKILEAEEALKNDPLHLFNCAVNNALVELTNDWETYKENIEDKDADRMTMFADWVTAVFDDAPEGYSKLALRLLNLASLVD